MSGTTVLVGTTKGAFLLSAREGGGPWSVSGPHCGGWPINHVIGEPGTGRLWAAGGSDWHGAGVWRSEDRGTTWDLAQLANGQMAEWFESDPETAARLGMSPPPPAPFTGEISAFWSLGLWGGTLYAGSKPAQLFASTDGGKTWSKNDALANFPGRDAWSPGAAGLVLHTIVGDPGDAEKMWLGVSAAGVFATEDGGASWERRNRRSNADAAGTSDHPASGSRDEIGHCVHNMVRAPGAGRDLLYQQNHHGVFRSPDGGRSWHEVTSGLPSTFGFPVAVHPSDPDTLWVLPLNGDMEGRFPPDAAAAVWRSRDGGGSWQAIRAGLPQEACYFTVLRQAMATAASEPSSVYFGTNTGSVFASHDEGESWTEIARHLPTVLSVETVQA